MHVVSTNPSRTAYRPAGRRVRGPGVRCVALGLFVVVASAGLGAASARASIMVNTTTDETTSPAGVCSLREAIAAANTPGTPSTSCPGASIGATTTILLEAGAYHLTLGTELELSGTATTIAIQGASGSPAQTSIDADGGAQARALMVDAGVHASIADLTVTGGLTAAGRAGGGATGNGGNGVDGGGIYNEGTLTVTNVIVSNNTTGGGGVGNASGNGGTGGSGGSGGNGGGIYNGGTLTVLNSVISSNTTGNGGDTSPGSGEGDGGAGGSGGGIYNTGTLTLTGSTLSANSAGTGGNAQDYGSNGGAGGGGGGVYSAGTLTVTNSTLDARNAAGDGGDGGEYGVTAGTGGAGGSGGGIFTASSSAALTDTTVAGDTAGAGGSFGDQAIGAEGNTPGGTGGAGGGGGGIFAAGSALTLTNTTIAGNTAGSGGQGGAAALIFTSGNGGAGGGGGGVAAAFSTLISINATISANGAGAGGAAGAIMQNATSGAGGAGGTGGGIATGFSNASEVNTLVASNEPQNCVGSITDGHHNLSYPDSTCPGINGDPELGSLQENGGATPTMALGAGSAAINQIPGRGANCPATDQRGVPRPQPPGGQCDIGAYEFVFPPICRPVAVSTASGQAVAVQLTCVDGAGAPLTYAIDTHPAHGSLGRIDASTGQLMYTPERGYSGLDSFAYHATSANGTAAKQTVSIAVIAPPAIKRLRVIPSRFAPAGSGGSIAPAPKPSHSKQKRNRRLSGATVSYIDTKAATTTFTILKATRGIRSTDGCVAPPGHPPKHPEPKACTRFVAVGSFRHHDSSGANSFHFTGRVNGHKLKPGQYRLQALPTVKGQGGTPTSTTFTTVA